MMEFLNDYHKVSYDMIHLDFDTLYIIYCIA